MRVDLRFLDGGGVDEIDFEIVTTFVAATLSKSSTGFTVPTLPGTFGQAAWGRSPGDSTSCFTSSRGGILPDANEDFGNDFGHPVAVDDACIYLELPELSRQDLFGDAICPTEFSTPLALSEHMDTERRPGDSRA